MSRAGLLTLLTLFAVLLAACDRASELIPGEGDATPESTALTGNPTPLVIPTDIETGTDTPTPTPSIPDHELARSVVQVQAIDTSNGFVRTVRDGTGVIVDREAGLILTAYPIVRPYLDNGARAYTVIGIAVNDGNGGSPRMEYEADLIAADTLLDLAVLRVTREYEGDLLGPDGLEFPAAEPGESSVVEPGDVLRLFGHPGLSEVSGDSQALRVTEGTVTGRRGEPDVNGTTRLKLNAQLPYGHTGGPAFNRGGALVGLLVPEHYDASAPVTQLRPLNLALDLVDGARGLPSNVEYVAPVFADEPSAGFEAAIPSDNVWVSRPLFAEAATSSGGAFDLFDYERGFVSGTSELYFEYVVQGANEDAEVEERWYLNGVIQDSLSSSYTWDGASFKLVSDRIAVPAASVLPDGRWRLEVWIDGTLRSQSTAIVGVELDAPAMFNPTFGSLAGANGLSVAAPSSTAQQLLLFFDYSGMDITQGVRWVVLQDGQVVYQSPELHWQGGGAGRFWIGYSSDEPIGAGRWSFEIVVDGESTLEAAWDLP